MPNESPSGHRRFLPSGIFFKQCRGFRGNTQSDANSPRTNWDVPQLPEIERDHALGNRPPRIQVLRSRGRKYPDGRCQNGRQGRIGADQTRMSDKVSQLYERALRNLKNSVSRAWARRNESRIRVSQTPPIFHPLAQRSAMRMRMKS